MEEFVAWMDSPCGVLELKSTKTHLKSVNFVEKRQKNKKTLPKSLKTTIQQLDEYFSGVRQQFDLPLDPDGTEFQRSVWKYLLEIPFAQTRSYLDISLQLGDRKATRAVGTANGKNPIAIIIPCHRVIGANGQLTGYAGGLERKKWLLEHEAPTTQLEIF